MTELIIPSQPEVPEPVPPRAVHWSSAIQFGLSALAIFILWSLAFSVLLIGLSARLGSLGEVRWGLPMTCSFSW